ncbi:DUF1631 family protein [Undibacterium oligocarboniphilum]|uniref:DUF1631 family protein n=1 Tax=Undibacterium oligocarboniphilum TaxID=666702 RepID=A0A850QH27_9BURK|nr:DUF1631 family protein [Undibacterium oligocarboniphilum]MBC3870611.1 DUF1631 family protein [Undibacterium oligocarboniphilum]NVO78588.1 DUF1631 family protein [Undibacterium oligocarboniphilum]
MNSPKKQQILPETASAGAGEVLSGLVPAAMQPVLAQLDAFSGRLSNAMLALSEQSMDSREANLSFQAGQLLKRNSYAFYHLAAKELETAFSNDIQVLLCTGKLASACAGGDDQDLSLVSYEEMDKKLTFSRISRTIELDNAEQYAALNMRLSHVLGRDTLSIAQNPFRPDIVLQALYNAWCQFEPEENTHELILPLLSADILFDLAPVLYELNLVLVGKGILPDLQESYRIRQNLVKKTRPASPGRENCQPDSSGNSLGLQQKLDRYFSGGRSAAPPGVYAASGQDHAAPQLQSYAQPATGYQSSASPAQSAFFQHLAGLQHSLKLHQLMAEAKDILRLSQIREYFPEMASSGVEKHTVDLLAQVFDHVFRNSAIPQPVKELISVLQVPVLKAALIDQGFFFKEQHPARRLIDLLSRYSPTLDQSKGQDDPLFQAMQKNVQRISKEFNEEIALFDEVVTDLENFIAKQETAEAEALQTPIQHALLKEKIKQASMTANNEVALRIGTGEVVAFVEAFLENRWIKVLTLAYSVQEEKPHAVEDALRTMDDLIWSVKPKITLQERQELLNRLPAILARLNKWLSLIKWQDEDRVRFFAELAECHASIVRAPLELSPDKQLELAVEAAQQAAERRLQKRAEAEKKAAQQVSEDDDESSRQVHQLERGIWINYIPVTGQESIRVRLAWVSPMRSLYIFTSSQKEKSFSIPVTELEQAFREQRAQVLNLDKVMNQALLEALETMPESTPDTVAPVADDQVASAA